MSLFINSNSSKSEKEYSLILAVLLRLTVVKKIRTVKTVIGPSTVATSEMENIRMVFFDTLHSLKNRVF